MILYDMIVSVVILLLNAFTIISYMVNIGTRLNLAINAKSKAELDFYFKMIMISLLGALMGGVSFYIGLKIWFKVDYLALSTNELTALRLVFAVLMGVQSSVMLILDQNYNPFRVK